MKNFKRIISAVGALCILGASALTFTGCSKSEETLVLRVSSWEEYIDLGEWDEAIDLESGDIIGEKPLYDEFTEWFNSNPDYDFKVKVEYSTFGTNEDLYNRLSLGDVYDLVCPSDYMIMKLIAEGNYVPFSDSFWNKDIEENYYAKGVSSYIDGAEDSIFDSYGWHGLAACYMWGTTGLVYNPEKVEANEVSTWKMLLNDEYKRQVTIKDNVRDAYFAALGIVFNETLLSPDITAEQRAELMNSVDADAVSKAEAVLKTIKDNVYSFETDSGKADMVTGKVLANYQWSGDAVLIMDAADDDGTELWYSVPDECSNIWFDGWLKLKNGVEWSEERKIAAEAFVNFLSRPDNAIKNMYYIGYTSAISGGDDGRVLEYMEWNYGAEDSEESVKYDVSYFFGEDGIIYAPAYNFEGDGESTPINRGRQLFAQYPPQNVIERSVIMLDFKEKLGDINQMWINVRCLDLKDISPVTIGVVAAIIAVIAIGICLYVFRYKIFYRERNKQGYKRSV